MSFCVKTKRSLANADKAELPCAKRWKGRSMLRVLPPELWACIIIPRHFDYTDTVNFAATCKIAHRLIHKEKRFAVQKPHNISGSNISRQLLAWPGLRLHLDLIVGLSDVSDGLVIEQLRNQDPWASQDPTKAAGIEKLMLVGVFNSPSYVPVGITNNLSKVRELVLCNVVIIDVSMLADMHSLELRNCPLVQDVSALGAVPSLMFDRCTGVQDVSALKHVRNLTLNSCVGIRDVSMLGNVRRLKLVHMPSITSAKGLGTVRDLTIDMLLGHPIGDLSPLACCRKLHIAVAEPINLHKLCNVQELELHLVGNAMFDMDTYLPTRRQRKLHLYYNCERIIANAVNIDRLHRAIPEFRATMGRPHMAV